MARFMKEILQTTFLEVTFRGYFRFWYVGILAYLAIFKGRHLLKHLPEVTFRSNV